MSGEINNPSAKLMEGILRPRPGTASSHLLSRLLESPWEFDFFQAVFLLKRFQEDVVDPGTLGPYSRESVRFSSTISLAFPASQIQNIQLGKEPSEDPLCEVIPSPPVMEVNFIGLQGPSGILPNFYTHIIQQLERNKENLERRSFRAWLDLFNHRLTSLFYRTWVKYRQSVVLESEFSRRPGGFDRFTETNLAILGMGQLVLRDRIGRSEDQFPKEDSGDHSSVTQNHDEEPGKGTTPFYPFEDRFFITHGAAFSRAVRTAYGLEAILTDYLGFPVQVQQFHPRWLAIDPDCQTVLAPPSPDGEKDPQSGKLYGGLGTGAVCGSRILEIQGHFRMRIGPLDEVILPQFLSTGCRGGTAIPSPLLLTVRDITRAYVRNGIDFDIQLVVRGEALPPPVLDRKRPVLGQSLWLFGKNPAHTVDDLVFFSEMSV